MKKPIQVIGPPSLLAALPYMLGFKPTNSLVCVLLVKESIIGCVRYEHEGNEEELFELIKTTIRNHQFDALVVVLAVTEIDQDCDALLSKFKLEQIELLDFLVTNWERYRSAICNDETCCPLQGNFLQATDHDQMAAELIANGHVAVNSRAELLARLNPVADRTAVKMAIDQATYQISAIDLMEKLTKLHRHLLQPTEIAEIVLALADPELRNVVEYELFESDLGELTKPDQLRLATANILHCAIHTPDAFAAMPYGLLSFCYWNLGEWILATAAAAHALELDPVNSPAKLTQNLIQQGVDPVLARREIFPRAA